MHTSASEPFHGSGMLSAQSSATAPHAPATNHFSILHTSCHCARVHDPLLWYGSLSSTFPICQTSRNAAHTAHTPDTPTPHMHGKATRTPSHIFPPDFAPNTATPSTPTGRSHTYYNSPIGRHEHRPSTAGFPSRSQGLVHIITPDGHDHHPPASSTPACPTHAIQAPLLHLDPWQGPPHCRLSRTTARGAYRARAPLRAPRTLYLWFSAHRPLALRAPVVLMSRPGGDCTQRQAQVSVQRPGAYRARRPERRQYIPSALDTPAAPSQSPGSSCRASLRTDLVQKTRRGDDSTAT